VVVAARADADVDVAAAAGAAAAVARSLVSPRLVVQRHVTLRRFFFFMLLPLFLLKYVVQRHVTLFHVAPYAVQRYVTNARTGLGSKSLRGKS
jgi:hypothetical protein